MNLRHTQVFVLGASLALVCFGASAQSASDLSRVEVSGHTLTPVTRLDVHATCANIDQQLQESLGMAVRRIGKEGEMQVQFELEGSKMIAVSARGGPMEYRQAVRRAVTDLSCLNGGAAQSYSFKVAFRPDDEYAAPGQNSVALLDH